MILIPFVGNIVGSFVVLLIQRNNIKILRLFNYTTIIVIFIVSVSLLIEGLIKALSIAENSIIKITVCVLSAFMFMQISDYVLRKTEKEHDNIAIIMIAMMVHNVPEGALIGITKTVALSLLIALQNIPESGALSYYIYEKTSSKKKAIVYSIYCGIVEPICALVTLKIKSINIALMPYLLIMAATFMLYCAFENYMKIINNSNIT